MQRKTVNVRADRLAGCCRWGLVRDTHGHFTVSVTVLPPDEMAVWARRCYRRP